MIAAVLAASMVGCASQDQSTGPVARVEAIEVATDGQMTVAKLESKLQAIAAYQLDRVIFAVDQIWPLTTSAEQRVLLARARSRFARAALEIASGPDAIAALLDMVVFLTLQDLRAHQMDEALGFETDEFVFAVTAGREDVWTLAERVLTAEQCAELLRMIEDWNEAHRDRSYVAEVRFEDFAQSRHGAWATVSERGLLRELDQATRAIDEARLMGERALFNLKYTPLLARWEATVLMYEVLALEEVDRFLAQPESLTSALDDLTVAIRGIPQDVREERVAAIEHAAEMVAKERKDTVDQILSGIAAERSAFIAELESKEGPLRDTVSDFRATIEAGDELVDSLTVSLETMKRLQDARAPAAPIEAEQLTVMAEQLRLAAEQGTLLVESLDDLLASEAWEDRTGLLQLAASNVEQEGERLVSVIFRVGVLLIGILLVGLVMARLVQEYLSRKLFGATQRRN